VLFVTPDYNRGVLGDSSAIDVGRGLGGVWDGMPAAVIASPARSAGANHHLRQSLVFLGMPAMQQPEAYIGGAAKLFDAPGALVNDATREFITKFMGAFAQWIAFRADPARRYNHCR
jgi:chromate reductase